MIPPRFNLSRVFLPIPSITGCLVDMATSIMILIVWNAQSIMAVYHKSSCPVSFFTYLIMIVATFIICLTTVLLVSDRYLVATCPYLYAEQVILYTFWIHFRSHFTEILNYPYFLRKSKSHFLAKTLLNYNSNI